MKQNILLYYDTDKEATQQLKLTCANNSFVSYHLSPDNTLILSDPAGAINDNMRISLVNRLKHLLEMNEVQSKVAFKFHHSASF